MDQARAHQLIVRFHEIQGEFYAGAPDGPLRELLTEDVVWSVPGSNAIAGVYEGIEGVMDYFARRRDLASHTFKMHPGEVLVGDGDHVAVLTDGTAIIAGVARWWSTIGLYRFRDERVAAGWLLPLDQGVFDSVWRSED